MDAFRFYWKAIKLTVRHSLDHTQYILFVLFLALGAASYIIPKLANWQAFVSGWQAAMFVLGSIVFIRLLLAPYWLYRVKAEEIDHARSQRPTDEAVYLKRREIEATEANTAARRAEIEQRRADNDPFRLAIKEGQRKFLA